MIRYALASLTPAVFLALGCLFGGVWIWLGLAALTVWIFAADHLLNLPAPLREDAASIRWGNRICVAMALAHFLLLGLGVHALAQGDNGVPALLALWLGLGMFMGQISHAAGHELIHAPQRGLRRLGTAIYTSLIFGHHVSAHMRVHHIWVATPQDPDSAPLGTGFYRFWPSACIGSFRAGLRAENRLRRGRATGLHPYLIYIAGGIAITLVAALIAGLPGILALFSLAAYAQMQVILSDYVQHYGLLRETLPDGRYEPVGPAHSWNAAPWYSAAMLLNAPRHSDHHITPRRRFAALRHDPGKMPTLPSSFPIMGLIATVPPLWKRVMNPRVARIRAMPPGNVNPMSTIGGETAPPMAKSGHAKTDLDSDRALRPASDRAIEHERRGF